MLVLNIGLNFLSLLVSLYAVIADSLLADYFSFKIEKCNFPSESSLKKLFLHINALISFSERHSMLLRRDEK